MGKEMKQLHWQNSFKPMHWKSLTAKQRKKVLESHIFVERKQDGPLKAQQVAGGNKQQGYIIKEDASSPTVSSETDMLTCVVRGICAPILLAQVAVLLKADFFGNPGRRIGTRVLLPFLALVGRLL